MTQDVTGLLGAPLPANPPPLGQGARKLLAAIRQSLTDARQQDVLYGRVPVVNGVISALLRDPCARDDDAAVLAALLERNS